jgi:hypothetical protein
MTKFILWCLGFLAIIAVSIGLWVALVWFVIKLWKWLI